MSSFVGNRDAFKSKSNAYLKQDKGNFTVCTKCWHYDYDKTKFAMCYRCFEKEKNATI